MRRVCPVCQQETDAATCATDGASTVLVGLGAQALVGQVVLQRYCSTPSVAAFSWIQASAA